MKHFNDYGSFGDCSMLIFICTLVQQENCSIESTLQIKIIYVYLLVSSLMIEGELTLMLDFIGIPNFHLLCRETL